MAPKALKMVLINQKPLDIWFLGKSEWKKIFLITNFKVSKRGRKNNENHLDYFRLVLTTRKGSDDKYWCFVSNGRSIWWQQYLVFLCIRNQTRWGTYCCMNPKMMGATCTNRLRSLLTMYHVLKFLEKGLKFHCNFWKVSITITLQFFLEYWIEILNQIIFSLFFWHKTVNI